MSGRPAVLASTALGLLMACYPFEPEGRRHRETFSSPLTRAEAHRVASEWLAERALYQITRTDPTFVRGEKSRRGAGNVDQVDVLSATIEEEGAGSRITVEATTDHFDHEGRTRADQVSPEAVGDAQALASVLMVRPF